MLPIYSVQLKTERGRADTMRMRRKPLPYTTWLLSGRQIFLAEGLDYHELTENVIIKLRAGAARRGLKLATKTVHDPAGFVFKAYLPNKPRPSLGEPTQGVTKNHYPDLFCHAIGCDNRLKPIDEEYCRDHKQ